MNFNWKIPAYTVATALTGLATGLVYIRPIDGLIKALLFTGIASSFVLGFLVNDFRGKLVMKE